MCIFSFVWFVYVACFSTGPTQYIFRTPMTRYSLFVLKVPLNTNKPNLVKSGGAKSVDMLKNIFDLTDLVSRKALMMMMLMMMVMVMVMVLQLCVEMEESEETKRASAVCT